MTRRMRILVAHNVSRQRTGGMSRFMGFIHDQISGLGHSVDYLCGEDLPERFRGKVARFWFPIMIFLRAREAARRGRPYNIVNVHEPLGATISLLKAAAGSPRVVVMCHSVERRVWEAFLEEGRLGRGGPPLKSRMVYPVTSLLQSAISIRRADHVLCRNSEDKNYLMTRYGVAAERLTSIPAGADKIYARASANRDYNRCQRLLFAGTWLQRKGIQDLLAAFQVLVLRHPFLQLAVLGAGTSESYVRSFFPQSIQPRVSCALWPLSDPEHAGEYSKADVYIFPTLSEGGTLTIAEAMMSGLPIVATDTCGMSDVVCNERNGLLVPIRSPAAIVEQVERLIADGGLRSRLGQAARAEALDKYTWDAVSAPVTDVYHSLCDSVT
jgi:glycosyltransferase involved in cell wall biosynthesis